MEMLLPQLHRKGREGLLLPPTPQCPAMTALMEFGWKLAARDTCGGQRPVLSEQSREKGIAIGPRTNTCILLMQQTELYFFTSHFYKHLCILHHFYNHYFQFLLSSYCVYGLQLTYSFPQNCFFMLFPLPYYYFQVIVQLILSLCRVLFCFFSFQLCSQSEFLK